MKRIYKCKLYIYNCIYYSVITGNYTLEVDVPDDAVDTYKAASGWSGFATRIFPMSQFATDFPNG